MVNFENFPSYLTSCLVQLLRITLQKPKFLTEDFIHLNFSPFSIWQFNVLFNCYLPLKKIRNYHSPYTLPSSTPPSTTPPLPKTPQSSLERGMHLMVEGGWGNGFTGGGQKYGGGRPGTCINVRFRGFRTPSSLLKTPSPTPPPYSPCYGHRHRVGGLQATGLFIHPNTQVGGSGGWGLSFGCVCIGGGGGGGGCRCRCW